MNLFRRARFWASLWGGKLWLWKIRFVGRPRNDRPGMVSMRLYPGFLYDVAKPKLTIVVSGTNGKTTTAAMVTDVLRARGMKVSFNDWGANHHAGVARVLLDGIDWRNRQHVDAAVIELDELISPEDLPALQPDYMIITNLARDSMLRNAHPDFIRSRLSKAVESSPNTTLILNADDPISSTLGAHHHRVFFGVKPEKSAPVPEYANDYPICDACGAVPEYRYRLYRHLGDVVCPKCGKKSPNRDFFVTAVNKEKRTMTVQEPNGTAVYPLASCSLHNVANEAAVATLLRTMGVAPKELSKNMCACAILPSRETTMQVGDVRLCTRIAKGQNPTAVNTVLDDLATDTTPKVLVMILDEKYETPLKTETIAWIYDVDYSKLNQPSVKKIIVGGARYLDHRLRLLLSGVPEEKMVCVPTEEETAQYVSTDGVEEIIVLHDVNAITRGRLLRDAIAEKIRKEGTQ